MQQSERSRDNDEDCQELPTQAVDVERPVWSTRDCGDLWRGVGTQQGLGTFAQTPHELLHIQQHRCDVTSRTQGAKREGECRDENRKDEVGREYVRTREKENEGERGGESERLCLQRLAPTITSWHNCLIAQAVRQQNLLVILLLES